MAPIISALSGLYKSLLYTASGFSASGGTIDDTSVTGYTIHTFDTVGPMTFSVTGEASIDLVVIGAGGGGGWNWGGGGGSGGLVVARDLPISTGSYAINIGNHPGTRAGPSSDQGDDGSPSTFVHPTGTFTGLGGGGGGYAGGAGRPGGSGGGTGNPNGPVAGTGTQPGQSQPSGAGIVSNYGWPGASDGVNQTVFGTPHSGQTAPDNAGFGGGGGGGQGKYSVANDANPHGGPGGTGVYLGGLFGDSHPGLDGGYAAGGGGGRGGSNSPYGDTTPTGGGIGGKGGGGSNNSNGNGDATHYGSGGAGNSSSGNIAGLGYKGAVILRYKTVAETFTAATGGDAVLTKGNYKYHIYTSTGNGTFNVSNLGTDKTIDILVVAGGGGGTHPYGAGGGGGGVIFTENYPLPASGTYNLRVGTGGASATGNAASSGLPSAFGTNATSSPYPAYSLVAIGGGRGANQNSTAPAPGGSGGGGAGNPGNTSLGGIGLQAGHTTISNFLPDASRWSGHGGTGGKAITAGQYGAGGGGAWGTDVRNAGPTDNRGGMGMVVPDGFLPQPFAPWTPGKNQFFGMPIPGNALGLRMFGGGGTGGPTGGGSNRNFGGGSAQNQSPPGSTTSNDYVAAQSDPGSGLNGRGGGGAGTNSDSNAGPGTGGSGSIIIRYKYQNS
jgi:hypothetical protein